MKLSVNLNKVALLRNSRGTGNPSMQIAATACIDAGAAGLTLHWREDNRHTRADDVVALRRLASERGVEFNLEGDTRDELVDLALELKVTQLTLVPVTPGEITSDHGWNLPAETERLAQITARARAAGVRTSIFVDPDPEVVAHVPATGSDRVEIYTQPYAEAFGSEKQDAELAKIVELTKRAKAAGIGVNAGHDLDLFNLPELARAAAIDEVSIGHALLCDAIYSGLELTVSRYLSACAGETVDVPRTW